MKALWNLLGLDLKLFFRNRQIVFFNFVAPVMLLVVFGFAFGQPSLKVTIGLAAPEGGPLASAVREALEASSLVDLREVKAADLEAAVTEREVELGVLVPASPPLRLFHTDPLIPPSELALSVAGDVLHRVGLERSGGQAPLAYAATALATGEREETYVDFVIPGILSMAVFGFCLFSIVYVVALRENGMLRRLQVTPLRRESFLGAQLLLRLTLIALQVAAILSLAAFVFGFRVEGSGWQLAVVLLLAVASFIGLSFALGGFSDNTRVASGLINLVYTPQVFLGGVFFPMQSLPVALQLLLGYLPLSCLVTAVRTISVDGGTLLDVQGQLAALVFWGVASFLVARRTFRWV